MNPLKPYEITDELLAPVPTTFKNWPSFDETIENLRKYESKVNGRRISKADIVRSLILLGFNLKVARLSLESNVFQGNTF